MDKNEVPKTKTHAMTVVTSIFALFAMPVLTVLLLETDVPAGNKDVIYLLAGQFMGSFATVLNYWLGSSRGSHEKKRPITSKKNGHGDGKMTFKLSTRSLDRLVGVHPDLVKVVKRAIELSPVDFTVIEGVRTLARQTELFNKRPKVTDTMRSKHLKQSDSYGHAVDLAPIKNGVIPWDDYSQFKSIADAMFKASKELNISIKWGGNFSKLKDGPHFEI